MSLAINTNFCGSYAGNVWGITDQCDKLAPTCEEYVARNPRSFDNTFWQINYIDVYKKPAQANSAVPLHLPSNSSILHPPASRTTTTTSTLAVSNNAVLPTRTRTITVSTVTQVISAAEPTRTSGGLADPAAIDGWTLLGCFGPLAGYKSFTQASSFPTMDNKACVASCAGHKYAGVSGETCYCADALGNATAVANDRCDMPCPGDPHSVCGGEVLLSASEQASSSSSAPGFMGIARTGSLLQNITLPDDVRSSQRLNPLLPRDDNNNNNVDEDHPPTVLRLLTVYGEISRDVPPGAPGKGASAPSGPRGGAANHQTAAATVTTSAVTVTFATVCPTDARRLITLEYVTTVTVTATAGRHCGGCATGMLTPTDVVPMTTYAQACDACGPRGERAVTLTVPRAMAAGPGGAHVMAVAVQTVVPVLASPSNSSSSPAITTPCSGPGPGASTAVPVVGAATAAVGSAAGFLRTLGCALALWLFVFEIGVIL
ncbi:putative endo- -beta- protein [Rosellinia necatrix]|uniref:Putative endo--beta-protein n=1 Tax=Rosellinia necatrix TaxID=77044 RepID=A0A1S8A8Q9_ROSNE|nr:putative endo- -beta- protein [Rosellinia necatrix]